MRDSDTIGRVGGDEFDDAAARHRWREGAALVADRARLALADGMVVEGHSISVSCSMGIAIYPQHGRTLSDLTNSADTAMYESQGQRARYRARFRKGPAA